MFRKNEQHLQMPLFSSIDSLPKKHQTRLEESWAGTFYHELFCQIDEGPFAVVYSDEASRPNIPVNVLVGFETLKSGFGWSDEEAYDHFCFDVQVRYALGYRDLSQGHFELRTIYNFRHRVAQHMQETGENLIERAVIMEETKTLTADSIPLEIMTIEPVLSEYDESLTMDDARNQVVDKFEKEYLSRLLTKYKGKINEVARHSGLSPRSIHLKMTKYSLHKEDYKNRL